MTIALGDWLPYVLPQAKGCPEITATFNVRLALIEFCRESLVWREQQAPIATVTGQTAYSYSPASGQQIVKLLGLRAGPTGAEGEIKVVDPRIGRSLDSAHSLSSYAYGGMSGIELRPALAGGQTITTYAAVAPSVDADTVPDAFSVYMEPIARGALVRLWNAPKRDYSDPAAAALAQRQWQDDIASARVDAFQGFSRTAPRVSAAWM